MALYIKFLSHAGPLAEHFTGVGGRELGGKAHFFGVGNAVDKQRFCAHKLSKATCEITRGRTGGHNNMRTHKQHNQKDFQRHPQKADFGIAVSIWHREEAVTRHIFGTFALNSGECNLTSCEGWTQSQELDPVPAA